MAIFKDKMITEMRIRGLTERTQAVYLDCMKHLTIAAVLYSTGIRLNELLNIKITDEIIETP